MQPALSSQAHFRLQHGFMMFHGICFRFAFSQCLGCIARCWVCSGCSGCGQCVVSMRHGSATRLGPYFGTEARTNDLQGASKAFSSGAKFPSQISDWVQCTHALLEHCLSRTGKPWGKRALTKIRRISGMLICRKCRKVKRTHTLTHSTWEGK